MMRLRATVYDPPFEGRKDERRMTSFEQQGLDLNGPINRFTMVRERIYENRYEFTIFLIMLAGGICFCIAFNACLNFIYYPDNTTRNYWVWIISMIVAFVCFAAYIIFVIWAHRRKYGHERE